MGVLRGQNLDFLGAVWGAAKLQSAPGTDVNPCYTPIPGICLRGVALMRGKIREGYLGPHNKSVWGAL